MTFKTRSLNFPLTAEFSILEVLLTLIRTSDMRQEEYRRYAQEARQQAERAISPNDKRQWLEIAEEWLKLATQTEGRRFGQQDSR